MDKNFENWLREFNNNREELKKGDVWNHIQGYNQNEKDLLNWYIQYKANLEDKNFQNRMIAEQTNLLWYQQRYSLLLAFATIILACTSILQILNIYKQNIGNLIWIFVTIIGVCVIFIVFFILEFFGIIKPRN